MKKIPTIFTRDFANRGKITEEWHPDCLWVRDGEGVPTVKIDGTSCLCHDGQLWKRREVKPGQQLPQGFMVSGTDDETGKQVGWVPVFVNDPGDVWHREAEANVVAAGKSLIEGQTYELIGPKVQGGKEKSLHHALVIHGSQQISDTMARTYAGIERWLTMNVVEGIVWHHPDGCMAKIKRRDFGLPW